MPFDQPTRNRLARFVGDARTLLSEEFTRQLQHEYGMDPTSGEVTGLDKLSHLDDARRETARILRETLNHYLAGVIIPASAGTSKKGQQEALQRIVREQAYTVLNRLAALRMAETRGQVIECVARGYQSRGFQLYAHLAGPALGETGDAYRSFLFSFFDELAVEMPALFDRFSPQGRLFPREAALLRLLDLLDAADLAALWGEDETIGWIYQYFNSSEERRQMRAESQAPRNSRELAVRNQFFTPRYVVQFLTDNTLGRIWYEMTRGHTSLVESCRYLVRRPVEVFLAEGEVVIGDRLSVIGEEREALSQEELLQQPVYIPHRPLKDPRDIKMLDPACGSMHFGLYSFDLYETIYAEAWDLEGTLGAGAFLRSEGLKPLRETYADKDALRRDVPRLIIEHNIHGIDIDPRAVQIAGLSLWLRAQRSWQEQGVKPQDRPRIQRSNIVCAEPMPGDKALLEEFLASLRADRLERLIRRVLDVPAGQQVRATQRMSDALCDLVRLVWLEMTLAGEAGSLLKIEETLANAIAAAEAEWSERMPLFRVVEFGLTGDADRVRYPRTVPDEDGADFWQRAEALVLAALQDYAEQAQNGAGYQRRLFAADAARGFAFIDVSRKHYDVALMNPPFGAPSEMAKNYLVSRYLSTGNDLYSMFTERGLKLGTTKGVLGAITSRTGFFLSSFKAWREEVLTSEARPTVVADLGMGVLDSALVETAAYCLGKDNRLKSRFLRVLADGDKANSLLEIIEDYRNARVNSAIYEVDVRSFSGLPGTPFSYWVTDSFRAKLSALERFEPSAGRARRGPSSGDDTRRLRTWWEVMPCEIGRFQKWVPYPKGGNLSPFYADIPLVVAWSETRRTFRDFCGRPGREIERPECLEDFFYPGLTWPRRASRFAPSVMPAGCIFSVRGQAILSDRSRLPMILGIVNSRAFDFVFKLSLGRFEFPEFIAGVLQKLPWLEPDHERSAIISATSLAIVAELRSQDSVQEVSHVFQIPSLVRTDGESIRPKYANWTLSQDNSAQQMRLGQQLIDSVVYEVLSISKDDRDVIEGLGTITESSTKPSDVDGEDIDDSVVSGDISNDVGQLLSWLLGCSFGRWDVLLATKDKPTPRLPDPFDPLPTCPPGMLQNTHGLPATPAEVPADYPLRISWPGILVDDPGHPEDIEARVRDALRVIWPDNADAIEQEACQILTVPSLRDYFASSNRFFDDHLKRYSKSRRVAPIYWPLSTPSGSYTLWLYYHRLSDQILYSCVNDFVEPKLAECRGQLAEGSRQRAAGRKTGSESRELEKEMERLSDLEAELREFRDELLRAAAFWKPNLNDGVQITAAPLWRLFQHRQWRQRLKETWEQLEAGEYDWAHLAMSTWPARVVPKCVTDRSLAIAHDLEDVFWVEDGGSWRNLRSPAEEIEAQKARQRSPAREQLRILLGELTLGRARGLRCDDVVEQLASGQWDDLEVALLLWPERVAEKCWDDPLLAVTLKVNLPTKRTKAARERFVKGRVEAGCPDLAVALDEALRDRPDRFSAFWSELLRGDHDDLALTLGLWPARVIDKCTADVELAARHDVRRLLWVRNGEDVWRRRETNQDELERALARPQMKGT